jgi:hypothetical protein
MTQKGKEKPVKPVGRGTNIMTTLNSGIGDSPLAKTKPKSTITV